MDHLVQRHERAELARVERPVLFQLRDVRQHEADRLGGAPRDAHVMVREHAGGEEPEHLSDLARLQERSELVEHRLG